MLPSEQRTPVAPLAHGGGLISKIFTPKNFYALVDYGPTFLLYTFFCQKHIANPKWLALSTTATKYNLQGPAMFRKHHPINLGHFISQIMQKASQSFYLIKANLTITSLINTLDSKPLLLTKNKSLRAPQTQYKRPQLDSKGTNHVLPT